MAKVMIGDSEGARGSDPLPEFDLMQDEIDSDAF